MIEIEIKNLYKAYGKKFVLEDINLVIKENERISIVGPNGSGKTTLIKCILGLVKPTKGMIKFNNINNDFRKYIGYVPQRINFPQNITLKNLIKITEDIRNEKAKRKDELLEVLNLKNELNKKVFQISGGNQQKIAIILSLMFDPKILILDEPFISLDPISSYQIKQLISKENKTIILISHIINEVESLTNKLLFLVEGKMMFYGWIDEIKKITNGKTLEESIFNILKNKERFYIWLFKNY